jgi:hypothetical protein
MNKYYTQYNIDFLNNHGGIALFHAVLHFKVTVEGAYNILESIVADCENVYWFTPWIIIIEGWENEWNHCKNKTKRRHKSNWVDVTKSKKTC